MTIQELLNSPPGTEFDLSLSEQDLNEAAGDLMSEQSGFPLSAPEVTLQDGLVLLKASTQFSGISLRAEVSGAPAVDNGELRFDVRDMLLNGGTAPIFVRDRVAASINEHLRGPGFPLDVHDVRVLPGELKVRGTKR